MEIQPPGIIRKQTKAIDGEMHMRKRTVKRYNRILAGALTVSLMISSMPANVQAQSVYQERSYAITSDADDEEVISDSENTEDNSAPAQDSTADENTTQASTDSEDVTTEKSSEDGEPSTVDTESTEDATETVTEDNTTESEESTSEAASDVGDDTEDGMTDSEYDIYGADAHDGDSIAELAASDLTIDELVRAGIVTYNDTDINVTDMEKGLILLSHCSASTYADKKITLSGTGNTNLTQKVTYNDKEYEYVPLGDRDNPFSGEITTQLQLNINKTLFGAVTSDAKVTLDSSKQIVWQGTSSVETLYADEYIFSGDADEGGQVNAQLNIGNIFKINKSSDGTVYNMGNLIGTVKAADGITAGTLEISGFNFANDGSTSNVEMPSSNAGLICNTLSAGTIKLTGGTLPANYTVASKSTASATGNAGGLIGEMAAGTGLCIGEGVTWNSPSVTVTSANGCAGGFVGKMGEGARLEIDKSTTMNQISVTSEKRSAGGFAGEMENGSELAINASVTMSDIAVSGNNMAGGIAGSAENVKFTHSDSTNLTFNTLSVTETFNGLAYAGGAFGKYTVSENSTFPDWISMGVSNDEKVKLFTSGNNAAASGKSISGGLFGELTLNNGATYSITGTSLYVDRDIDGKTSGRGTAYGSIVGIVTVGDNPGVLTIAGKSEADLYKITSNPHASNKTYYHGGLVGKLDSRAYVNVKNVEITMYNPYGEGSARGAGGLAGRLASNSVLKTGGTVKIATQGIDPNIWEGGGIVGWAESGSVLELSGTTDISGEYFTPRYQAGLIAGYQDSALIYALGSGNDRGWTYIRPADDKLNYKTETNKLLASDDIGNYGQVIRLGGELSQDLIVEDESSHRISLKNVGKLYSDGKAVIDSAEKFALLAITWQSRGVFSGFSDVTTANWTELNSADIKITCDVDMTGTGIQGLTRDNIKDDGTIDDTTDIFKGKIDGKKGDGKSSIITLAIGESFGFAGNSTTNADSYSSGHICRHRYQGLFGIVKGVTAKNLTIKGSMNVNASFRDNNDEFRIYGGGIAGEVYGGTIAVDSVETDIEISMSSTDKSYVYAGGLFGYATGYGSVINIGQNGIVTTKAKITTYESAITSHNNKNVYGGGAIGAVYGGVTINAYNVKLSGSIQSSSEKNIGVQAGGLLGLSAYGNTNTINIIKIEADGLTIDKSDSAVNSGGILGYLWADVNVDFTPSASDATGYALTVTNATINTPKASMGGLVYRSSGKWQINDSGINMSKASFTAKDIGLLVCHMDIDSTQNDTNKKALYLEFTANWDSAYKLGDVTANSSGVFDEIAAYTAPSVDKITDNETNGVISLETVGSKGVDVENTCNTYINRTEFGKTNKTNGNSRYYYNLYSLGQSNGFGTSGNVNTPQRLLAWSIYKYVPDNLKTIMFKNCGLNSINTIDGSGSKDFDMEGLSYYPVNVGAVTVQNVNIKFYNEEIEAQESSNKSTGVKNNSTTQHYMMHCGLFYNMAAGNNAVSATVKNVSFAGTVGKVKGGSGVLSCGTITGDSKNMKLYTLGISSVVLDGIRITGMTEASKDYAPLLINQAVTYTTLEVTDVKVPDTYKDNGEYKTKYGVAASSLIGKFGDKTATQISISFSEMVLPDKSVDNGGIFTHATFLESYQYVSGGIASGTYNFTKAEDWTGNIHIKHVTYGKEISDSVQYSELQKWYYDEDTYSDELGEVVDDNSNKDFSSYLNYVYSYEPTNQKFEIKVNQRIADLTDGCGSYGHPYKLKSSLAITTVAEYISTGTAKADWKVAVTSDQKAHHTDSASDVIYAYSSGAGTWQEVENTTPNAAIPTWKKVEGGKTLGNDVMHRYICSAYYDIQYNTKTASVSDAAGEHIINVKNFSGFGSAMHPFRGVITCTQDTPVTIELEGSGNGLIQYGYGCVIRNINVRFTDGTVSVLGTDETVADWDSTSNRYKTTAFWGGVIGCVLGGDNIIDNVTVSMNSDWKLSLDGAKNYLIQAGGYVGSVVGGGVVFRNMSGKTGLADANLVAGSNAGVNNISVDGSASDTSTKSLYVNPFVGRVLDGYAFSEDCVVDNGTKTYKVNKLTTGKSGDSAEISTSKNDSVYETTISSAQGLLVFSAIVNSGSATGASEEAPGTLAYYGKADSVKSEATDTTTKLTFGNGQYGKVRNADYKYIGQTGEAAENDFSKSVFDDTTAPGSDNTPYLVTKYADSDTFGVCSKDAKLSVSLVEGETYDMTGYGNGYQGISVRYISNAINNGTSSTSDNWDFSYAMPKICGFDGNGSTIKVAMNIKEYVDDDFHGVSFGGVFNLIRAAATNECGVEGDRYLVRNLKIADSTVSFGYYKADGTSTDKSDLEEDEGRLCVAVGGFAGNTAKNGIDGSKDDTAKNASYTIEQVVIENTVVTGPSTAGGFMGATGMSDENMTSGISCLYKVTHDANDWNSFGANFVNCTYSGSTIIGEYFAGGFVGYMAGSKMNFNTDSKKIISSVSVTDDSCSVVGKNSTITAKDAVSEEKTNNNMYISGAGGLFGKVGVGLYINDITVNEAATHTAKLQNLKISSRANSGGLVGCAENNDCKIYNSYITRTENSGDSAIVGEVQAGGIIGSIKVAQKEKIVEIKDCNAENIIVKGGNTGSAGIVGGFDLCSSATMKVIDCGVNKSIIGCLSGSEKNGATLNNCAVGGIVGNIRGNGSDSYFVVEGCSVENSTVGDKNQTAEWNGGLIGSMYGAEKQNVYVYNSYIDTVTVGSGNSKGNSGGLMCSAHGTVYCSNFLINKLIVVNKSNDVGFIYNATRTKTVRVAGLSVKNSEFTSLLGDESSFQLGTTSYISFADYTGSVQQDTAEDAHKHLLGIKDEKVVSPYVSTSPKSTLAVISEETEKYLHGDGAKWSLSADGKTFTTLAKTIVDERNKTSLSDGKYPYKRIGTDAAAFDFTNNISTYNNNQTVKAAADFPVLQVAGGTEAVDSTIAQYLDIVTNGGYSNAVKCNPATKSNNTFTSVSAKTEICVYDKDTGKFTLAPSGKSALTVSGDGTSSMKFAASTGYDNDQSRFTLLTVTWNAENEHTYSIQVPVIVKRIMEIDFMATLGYGTHFRAGDYDNLTTHVLDSFENPMTGYLTYKYNSAKGVPVSYGWQDYVNNGGDLTLSIDKTIQFNAVLPVGTQLTLVDCQDADRTAYTYTVSEIKRDDAGKAQSNSVAMSAFARESGGSSDGEEAGKTYFTENIGRALGAVVSQDNKGTFIEVDENGKPVGATDDSEYSKPTVNIDGKYYRLMASGESEYQKYTVTIDESKTAENYYLVVTMPKTAEITVVNGWLETTVDVQVPHNIHNMLRNAPTGEDGHGDTASTYQISDGYQQVLTDEYNGDTVKLISSTRSTINVEVMDEISFPADQQYKDIDQLYQRFVGSLQNILRSGDDSDSTTTSYKQFPMGTAGTVKFYVYTVDTDGTTKHYYIYGDENGASDTWTDMGADEYVALQYPWVSDGGDMELVLSTDGTTENAVSLQKIRKDVIDKNQQKKIYVKAVLNAVLPAASFDVIPLSTITNGEPGEYAKLSYVAQVSTEKTSLSYSSSKATLAETKVKYYREDQSGAKLTYDAPDIDQLGINLLDLGDNVDAEKSKSLINTIARFDLSTIQDLESVLGASEGVQFELSLKRKNTDSSAVQEDYEDVLPNTSSYMSVQLLTGDSGTVSYSNNADSSGIWTWTIPKNTYITSSADGQNTLKTSDAFDGSVFTQALDLYVNVDNVEELKQFYSNYKVELSVKILGSDITGNDNIIYTLTRIKPEFVEKN